MNWCIIVTALTITLLIKTKSIEGRHTPLPQLPNDLQDLLDSLYNSGYLPEYLQEELAESEKSNGDYLDFPDFKNSQGNAESLNHPTWLSYQKEVFVPPESEYKNIIAHKNERSHQKLAPFINPPEILWEQFWRQPFLDPKELRAELLAPLTDNFNSNITGNISSGMDFLHPIPEKGHLPASVTNPLLYSIPPIQNLSQNLIQQQPKINNMNVTPTNNTMSIPRHALNINQIEGSQIQPNAIASSNSIVKASDSSASTGTNNKIQVAQIENGDDKNKQQSQTNGYKNSNIIQIHEVEVAESQSMRDPNEQPKKVTSSKKKIFSLLNVFKKGSKHNNTSLEQHSTSSPAHNFLRKEKPATLQELYNQLIEARNSYENNNRLVPNNEEALGQLNNIGPKENIFGQQESEVLGDSQDLEKTILNEGMMKIPHISYLKNIMNRQDVQSKEGNLQII